MEILWNPSIHTDEENVRWAFLRAIEWGSWPTFLGQALGPIFFPFYSWWKVAIAIVIADWLWSLIRYVFVSPFLAEVGVFVVLLKWLICPSIAVFFLIQHDVYMFIISLSWLLISVLIDIPTPSTPIGFLQRLFLKSMVK